MAILLNLVKKLPILKYTRQSEIEVLSGVISFDIHPVHTSNYGAS